MLPAPLHDEEGARFGGARCARIRFGKDVESACGGAPLLALTLIVASVAGDVMGMLGMAVTSPPGVVDRVIDVSSHGLVSRACSWRRCRRCPRRDRTATPDAPVSQDYGCPMAMPSLRDIESAALWAI